MCLSNVLISNTILHVHVFWPVWRIFSSRFKWFFFSLPLLSVLKKQIMNNYFFHNPIVHLPLLFFFLFQHLFDLLTELNISGYRFTDPIQFLDTRNWEFVYLYIIDICDWYYIFFENCIQGYIRPRFIFAPLATTCQQANFRLNEIQCLRLSLFKYMTCTTLWANSRWDEIIYK